MKVTLVFTALLVASTSVFGAPSGDYGHGATDAGYGAHTSLTSSDPAKASVNSVGYQSNAPAVAPVAAPVPATDYQSSAPVEKPVDSSYRATTPVQEVASVTQPGYQAQAPVQEVKSNPQPDYAAPSSDPAVAKLYDSPAPVDNGYAKIENVAIRAVENVNAYTTPTPTPTTTPCATETVQPVATSPCDEKTAVAAAPTQYQDVAVNTVDAYAAIPTSIPTDQYNGIASVSASGTQGAKGSLYGQSSDANRITTSAFAVLLVSGVGLLAL